MKKLLAAQAKRCWLIKFTKDKKVQVKSILVPISHFTTFSLVLQIHALCAIWICFFAESQVLKYIYSFCSVQSVFKLRLSGVQALTVDLFGLGSIVGLVNQWAAPVLKITCDNGVEENSKGEKSRHM